MLPPLLANRNADDLPFRVWTPGCSSGEESYSIAMLLQELLERRPAAGSVQVFGTDIDNEALSVARKGAYPEAITSTVSAQTASRIRTVTASSLASCRCWSTWRIASGPNRRC